MPSVSHAQNLKRLRPLPQVGGDVDVVALAEVALQLLHRNLGQPEAGKHGGDDAAVGDDGAVEQILLHHVPDDLP